MDLVIVVFSLVRGRGEFTSLLRTEKSPEVS